MKQKNSLGLSSSRVFTNILFRRGCPILFPFQFPFGFLFCPSAPIFTLGNRRENTNISCNSLSQENVCKSLICIIRNCLRQDQTHNFPANSDLVIQLALSPQGDLAVMFCQDLLSVCLGVSLSHICTGCSEVAWERKKVKAIYIQNF